MEIALWIGGIAYAILASIGGMAYQNSERWPVFKHHVTMFLLVLSMFGGGAACGIQFDSYFPEHRLEGWATAAIAAVASHITLALVLLADWLRKP